MARSSESRNDYASALPPAHCRSQEKQQPRVSVASRSNQQSAARCRIGDKREVSPERVDFRFEPTVSGEATSTPTRACAVSGARSREVCVATKMLLTKAEQVSDDGACAAGLRVTQPRRPPGRKARRTLAPVLKVGWEFTASGRAFRIAEARLRSVDAHGETRSTTHMSVDDLSVRSEQSQQWILSVARRLTEQ